MKILVFGLPDTGKTTFARELHLALIGSRWMNGDSLRGRYDDWDFSEAGRERQLQRMIQFSNSTTHSICDFVCPKQEYRDKFNADITVWLNTKSESIYEDTNKLFEKPQKVDYQIDTFEQKADVIKCIYHRMKCI